MKTMFLAILAASTLGVLLGATLESHAQTPPQTPRREQPKPLGKPKKTDAGVVNPYKPPINPVDHRGGGRN